MSDIKPIDFESRLNNVVATVAKNHNRQVNGHRVMKWRRLTSKGFKQSAFTTAAIVTACLVYLKFTVGFHPAMGAVAVAVSAFLFALIGYGLDYFGEDVSGIPEILGHFFRLNRKRVNDIHEKCRVFDAMIETLPRMLEAVSNKVALLQTQQQRRAALDAEVEQYFKDLELVNAIYWLDNSERLGIDVDAYGVTGNLTALVSVIQAREELSENFPSATHRQLTA